MKLNKNKVGTMGRFVKDCDVYEYGWYDSGRAFVAVNGEIMLYADAYKELVPKCSFNLYDYFYVGTDQYPKSLTGIVRYLIDTHNKD